MPGIYVYGDTIQMSAGWVLLVMAVVYLLVGLVVVANAMRRNLDEMD